MTKPGDVDHYTRVRTYKALAEHYYEPDRIVLSLLPLATRMAGPREALWHAIIRRNYGANHLIVGRDYATPEAGGAKLWEPYAARELVSRYAGELQVAPVALDDFVFLPAEGRYAERSAVAPGSPVASLSDAQVREAYLERGERLPEWF